MNRAKARSDWDEWKANFPSAFFAQPDDTTCGPTCLHAVYGYYGDEAELDQVIQETVRLEHGGTLALLLGCHALRRGYQATIYTYHLQVFDPTWFVPGADRSTSVSLLKRRRRNRSEFARRLQPTWSSSG